MRKKELSNQDIETLVIDSDQDWEDDLNSMEAEALGLTVEELIAFRELDTEEEMQQFMDKHSTKKQ